MLSIQVKVSMVFVKCQVCVDCVDLFIHLLLLGAFSNG